MDKKSTPDVGLNDNRRYYMRITRERLANLLIIRFNFSKLSAETLTENFFEEICRALINGHAFKVNGFGNFTFVEKR